MVMGAKINVRCAKVEHRWSVLLDFSFNKLMTSLSAKSYLGIVESTSPDIDFFSHKYF